MPRNSFDFTADRLLSGVFGYVRSVEAATKGVMKQTSERAQKQAKTNHPWINRTEDAEKGLTSDIRVIAKGKIELYLAHGPNVPYGWWLEVRWKGKFAVIAPTLESNYAPLMANLQRIFG
jgi:hypothetical protein